MSRVNKYNRQKEKKVLVFGTFDLLHPGHKYLLKEAKKKGDFLIVVVARDKTVKKLKDINPTWNEKRRKREIEKLTFVDKAMLGFSSRHYQIANNIKPDIICLGYDQVHFIDHLKEELKKRGLKPKIIRLKSYKPRKYKTSKIKRLSKK